MTTLTIPRQITKGEELIVLKKNEYLFIRKQLDELKDALSAIREGEKAYRKGTARKVSSLNELI